MFRSLWEVLLACVGALVVCLVVVCLCDTYMMHGSFTRALFREYRAILNGVSPWAFIVLGAIPCLWWLSRIWYIKGAESDLQQALNVQDPFVGRILNFIHHQQMCLYRFAWVALIGLGFIGWGIVRLLY